MRWSQDNLPAGTACDLEAFATNCAAREPDGKHRPCVLPAGHHPPHEASVPGGHSRWTDDYDPAGYTDEEGP